MYLYKIFFKEDGVVPPGPSGPIPKPLLKRLIAGIFGIFE